MAHPPNRLRGSRLLALLAIPVCAACSPLIAPSEIEGVWRQRSRYVVPASAETRLEFRSDGTFRFAQMPGAYFGPFVTLPLTVAAEGGWTLTQEDGNQRVRLQTLTIDGEAANFESSMSVSGDVGDRQISFPLGDPDGAWVFFEKAQFVRAESDRKGSTVAVWDPRSARERASL